MRRTLRRPISRRSFKKERMPETKDTDTELAFEVSTGQFESKGDHAKGNGGCDRDEARFA